MPLPNLKGYFLSLAQRTNHLIELSPYNQYQLYSNHSPTIYPNSAYCSIPFCGFAPHTWQTCAVCAQYKQSICIHKLQQQHCIQQQTIKTKYQNLISPPPSRDACPHSWPPPSGQEIGQGSGSIGQMGRGFLGGFK